MNEPVSKDSLLSALHEVQMNLTTRRDDIGAAIIQKSCEEITELRRSLVREENARKVLAETNQRLVAEIKSLGGGYTKVHQ